MLTPSNPGKSSRRRMLARLAGAMGAPLAAAGMDAGSANARAEECFQIRVDEVRHGLQGPDAPHPDQWRRVALLQPDREFFQGPAAQQRR